MRITGLAAASSPSMKTLNTTLGCIARLEPFDTAEQMFVHAHQGHETFVPGWSWKII